MRFKKNDWKYDFNNLDVYCKGERIEYTIIEDVPNNYTESYNYTVNITISHEHEDVPPVRGVRSSVEEDNVIIYLIDDDSLSHKASLRTIIGFLEGYKLCLDLLEKSDYLAFGNRLYEYSKHLNTICNSVTGTVDRCQRIEEERLY